MWVLAPPAHGGQVEVLCCLPALPAPCPGALPRVFGLQKCGCKSLGTLLERAACRSCSEKIQLQELAYKKGKDLCLNAHAVFFAFTHSDSGGLGIPSEQRCSSAVCCSLGFAGAS